MANDMPGTVRELCLWLPEAEEFVSHGAPNFRVRGKTFATYMVNHHGDGRVALWLAAQSGAQETFVTADPVRYFVPPYVGPRGWLGVRLDRRPRWQHVAARVREAYARVAPAALSAQLGKLPQIVPPVRALSPGDVDPLAAPRGRALLKILRAVCQALPESREVLQFGQPAWQAGKKTYLSVRASPARLGVCFWVGVDCQNLLTADSRFSVPAYLGHNGWIELEVGTGAHRSEIAALALQSYRHFALRRMLEALDAG